MLHKRVLKISNHLGFCQGWAKLSYMLLLLCALAYKCKKNNYGIGQNFFSLTKFFKCNGIKICIHDWCYLLDWWPHPQPSRPHLALSLLPLLSTAMERQLHNGVLGISGRGLHWRHRKPIGPHQWSPSEARKSFSSPCGEYTGYITVTQMWWTLYDATLASPSSRTALPAYPRDYSVAPHTCVFGRRGYCGSSSILSQRMERDSGAFHITA